MNWDWIAGLFVGLIAGMLLMSILTNAKQNDPAKNTARVIQMVGRYVADPSHDNWYHLGAAYAQWLEEA